MSEEYVWNFCCKCWFQFNHQIYENDSENQLLLLKRYVNVDAVSWYICWLMASHTLTFGKIDIWLYLWNVETASSQLESASVLFFIFFLLFSVFAILLLSLFIPTSHLSTYIATLVPVMDNLTLSELNKMCHYQSAYLSLAPML